MIVQCLKISNFISNLNKNQNLASDNKICEVWSIGGKLKVQWFLYTHTHTHKHTHTHTQSYRTEHGTLDPRCRQRIVYVIHPDTRDLGDAPQEIQAYRPAFRLVITLNQRQTEDESLSNTFSVISSFNGISD